MKKFMKHFKAAYKDPANQQNHQIKEPRHHQSEIQDPKYIVDNSANPYPAPVPTPAPYPDNKGISHRHEPQPSNDEDVGTFSGFGSWMASFEPDPGARGVVEIPGPQPSQPIVPEVLSLAEGCDPYSLIRLTLHDVRRRNSLDQNVKCAVQINGPWFMTLAQVNRLLEKHGYQAMATAKHRELAARNWNGEKALPTELQIPIIRGLSRYEHELGEGPLISQNEKCGTFLQNLRRLRVRCNDGKVLVTSYPGELEISFNRTLRLPEDGKTHSQPIRLGKIDVNSVVGISKKLETSGNQSLVDMARKGGVFFPLYQREAMFLSFKARQDAFAVRVFVGGVNAVSGLPWSSPPGYKVASQEYLSIPPQQFLDGVCVAKDVVKQFVAMPLGSGYSVEKQVTGKETVGGMQLEIIPGDRWSLYVPASDKLPQPGPYYPDPGQVAGSLGVDMVVLGDGRDLLLPGHKGDQTLMNGLVDKSMFPVYMRHLYQSQVEAPYPSPVGKRTEFQPGMHVQMTAVYKHRLTLRYVSHTYGQDQTETVNWAPWWTLDRCFSDHVELKSQASPKSLRDLELCHQGRPLQVGSLSLQDQGVPDGAVVEVREQQSYGRAYSMPQYPDAMSKPYQPQQPHQGGGNNYPTYQQQQEQPHQQQSYYPPPPTSYGSPVPSYSSPQQNYISSPSSASPATPQPYVQAMPTPSFPPVSAQPPKMSAPPPMPQQPMAFPQPAALPPQQQMNDYQPQPSYGGTTTGHYGPSASSAASPSSAVSSYYSPPPRGSAPAMPGSPASQSSPPPLYESYSASYQQQSAPPPRAPVVRPAVKPQDQTGWAMGLAAGSKIHQAILADPFAPFAWRKGQTTMLSVQILNSVAFEALTGMLAPSTPITPEMYIEQGLPFLKSYEEGIATDGSAYLAGIKGVGDIDAQGGGVHLGSNMTGGMKIGCTACGKMLCDSILRPCNHAFCSNCIKQSMTYPTGPGTFATICSMCNTKATKLIGFSAPMALPGEDVIDLSEANIITVQPFQGGFGFHSVHELPAGYPDKDKEQDMPPYPCYDEPYYEMQA